MFNALRWIATGFVVATVASAATGARAQDYAALIAAPDRSDADRQADAKRDPLRLLTFVAPKSGWKVLDMDAGAGYSTELMARTVAPGGRVFAQSSKVSDKLAERMKSPAMANVELVVTPFDDLTHASLRNLDLITFFFGYHDTTFLPVDRAGLDRQMFDALKQGGILVVVDYSARPEDGAGVGKTWHRIAEHTLRTEIEAAGFVFVDDSDFLRHPEDTRTETVFRNPTPVDAFALKFRKP